jgi:hypothetical protein
MAALSNNGVYERLVTPSAVIRTRHATLKRPSVAAACAYPDMAAAVLKASPEGEGFNPPSGGQ